MCRVSLSLTRPASSYRTNTDSARRAGPFCGLRKGRSSRLRRRVRQISLSARPKTTVWKARNWDSLSGSDMDNWNAAFAESPPGRRSNGGIFLYIVCPRGPCRVAKDMAFPRGFPRRLSRLLIATRQTRRPALRRQCSPRRHGLQDSDGGPRLVLPFPYEAASS